MPLHHLDLVSSRPLARSQRRLWFLQHYLADKTAFNLLLVCYTTGDVQFATLRDAFTHLMRRHEVLRSKFLNTPSSLQQVPSQESEFQLSDAYVPSWKFESLLEETKAEARNYEFNLETGEIIRGWLLRSNGKTAFFLGSHHIAWDRASVPAVSHEVTSIYKCLSKKQASALALPSPKYQFVDYALWQESWMHDSTILNPHLDYWQSKLSACPESISLLPFACVTERPIVKQHEVDTLDLKFDVDVTNAVKKFCSRKALTPFMFMTATVCSLICRLTGDNDVVVGIADGDRGHTEFDQLIGFTVNMLALRIHIAEGQTFNCVLETFRETCLQAYEHRIVPFDYLLQQLNIPRRTSHSPLFQVTVNYQTQGFLPEYDFGNFRFTAYDHYSARASSDFSFDFEEMSLGALHCQLSYDKYLYSERGMEHFIAIFKTFLENLISTEADMELGKINTVPPLDRSLISSVLQSEKGPEHEILGRSNDTILEIFDRIVIKEGQRQRSWTVLSS